MGIPKSLTVCFVVAICGAAASASAAHQTGRTDQEVVAPALTDAEKDAFIQLAMRTGGLPGLQTVVVKNGKIVWTKSYGYAVLDEPGPRRQMRNDSILWSASVAKILVTIAVLQQVEKGRITLEDDIDRFVPFRVRNPKWPDVPITWRMLLTHTSSLNEEDDARLSETLTYGKDPTATLNEIVRQDFAVDGSRRWAEQWRAAKPGTERIYSNDAFALAGFALQTVMHEPLDRYVQYSILDPLGMRSSSYRLANLPTSRLAVGYASIRQPDGSYRFVTAKSQWAHGEAGGSALDHQMSCPDYPPGCAHITSQDFAQLLLMLMNKGTVNGKVILQPTSVELMVTPSGFRNLNGWNQGLGLWGPVDLHGRQLWGHNGIDRGAANSLHFNPKTGVGAIAFANANDPDFSLSYGVTDIVEHLISWYE
jgi:CubicO group peptidase (beta-lactamase class C family)